MPLAYDRIPDPNGSQGQGSKARCRAVIRKTEEYFYDENVHGRFWVLTAGRTKECPDGNERESLAWQMYSYIIHLLGEDHPLLDEMFTLMSARVWGTMGEVSEAIRLIQKQLDSYKKMSAPYNRVESVTVFFSTNWAHAPRVWLCWYYLAPKAWKIRYIFCHHPFGGWKEYVKEAEKCIHYWRQLKKMNKQKPG
jgi:hypothetical protein